MIIILQKSLTGSQSFIMFTCHFLVCDITSMPATHPSQPLYWNNMVAVLVRHALFSDFDMA